MLEREEQFVVVRIQNEIKNYLHLHDAVPFAMNNLVEGHRKMLAKVFTDLEELLDGDLRYYGPPEEVWAIELLGKEYDGDDWVTTGNRYTESSAKAISKVVGGEPVKKSAIRQPRVHSTEEIRMNRLEAEMRAPE